MALLDTLGGMGGMSGMGAQGGPQMDPMQLMQMLQMSQKDPFTKSMPGDALLGPGGMGAMPAPMPQQTPEGVGLPQVPGMNTISTDFADTQPGLPNLPDNFKGFGFGQYAPQEHQANPRQQLIQQLMQALSMNGIGGPQNGGMGGQGMGGF